MIRRDETRLGSFEVVRGVDAGTYLETLLVSAIASVLAIRAFLWLTGFPQLGGGGLHIAHMLWGGLLMLAGLVVLVTFLGRTPKHIAAVLGGVGFGAFIDELGKFITSDNDYFYKPTMALIYVIFIGLFFLFRSIERRRQHSRRELLVNAADSLVELLLDRASAEERARALYLLEQSGDRSPVAAAIRQAAEAADPADHAAPSLPTRLADSLRRTYRRVVAWRWFHRAVVFFLLVRAGWFLLVGTIVLISIVTVAPGTDEQRALVVIGILFPTAISSALAVVGAIRLRRSRLDAYRWLKRSLLVSILVLHVFVFYLDELGALRGLALDLVLLAGINYVLGEESAREEAKAVREAAKDQPGDLTRLPVGGNGRQRNRAR